MLSLRQSTPPASPFILSILMTLSLCGCPTEPLTPAPPDTGSSAPARPGPRAKASLPLPDLMKRIAACTSWSPINGLNRSGCKAFGALTLPAAQKPPRNVLARYLGAASAPVRYAAAYALCHPVTPLIKDRTVGVAILEALDREPARATITWLGLAAGGIQWRATQLGDRIRRMASSHPKRGVRHALLGSLTGGRDRLSTRRFDFLVDRTLRDGDPHARVLAMGALTMARNRRESICALWLQLAQQRQSPRVASQAAMRLTYWKGQLQGKYQPLCADQHGPLLLEILRRLRTYRGVGGSHFVALDRLCDARHARAHINRQCWQSVRSLLKTNRHRARLLTTLADRDPHCAAAAEPYLGHRDLAVRRAARRAARPKVYAAESFLRALTSGHVARAHLLVARDRWHLVKKATMKRWVRQNVKKRHRSRTEPIRLELADRRDGESTQCWRRRYPSTRMTGSCRNWTTRWTELRFKHIARPLYRRRPLLVVRVADYFHQPKHPDASTNRLYRHGKRYQVVGWRTDDKP